MYNSQNFIFYIKFCLLIRISNEIADIINVIQIFNVLMYISYHAHKFSNKIKYIYNIELKVTFMIFIRLNPTYKISK